MRLAFVTPRYGSEVLGGSEALMAEEARGLAARGHAVEVLTTCARDGGTWANEWPAGTQDDEGVVVRRFSTVPVTDTVRRDALDHLVLGGRTLCATEEAAWIDSRYAAPGLLAHLSASASAYDAVVFSPYLAWTTLRGLAVAPDRSILMACLHDEPAARLRSVRAALAGAGEVWFLSEPEHQLAHRLVALGHHRVVGSAVKVPARYAPEQFCARHHLERPFVLYAGRREDGKGWPEALSGFTAALERHRLVLDLVTIGAGDPVVAGSLAGKVVDLGFLGEAEVPDAFAAARAYLQPSRNESFSRTIMESWLAGTPVVASSAGEVVAWHCERSGGGLVYSDAIEMGECLRALLGAPGAAADLAAAGRRYVLEHYTWPTVLDTTEQALEEFGARRAGGKVTLGTQVRRRAAAVRRGWLGPDAAALSEWLPAAVPPAPPASRAPAPRPTPRFVSALTRALGRHEAGRRVVASLRVLLGR